MLKHCFYYFVVVPGACRDPSKSQSQTNTQRKTFPTVNRQDVEEWMHPHDFFFLSYISNLFVVFQEILSNLSLNMQQDRAAGSPVEVGTVKFG